MDSIYDELYNLEIRPSDLYKLHANNYESDSDSKSSEEDDNDDDNKYKPRLYTYEELEANIVDSSFKTVLDPNDEEEADDGSKKPVEWIASHLSKFITNEYCFVCREFDENHYKKSEHFRNVHKWIGEKQSRLERPVDRKLVFCDPCNQSLTGTEASALHYLETSHLQNAAAFCSECLLVVPAVNMLSHQRSMNHNIGKGDAKNSLTETDSAVAAANLTFADVFKKTAARTPPSDTKIMKDNSNGISSKKILGETTKTQQVLTTSMDCVKLQEDDKENINNDVKSAKPLSELTSDGFAIVQSRKRGGMSKCLPATEDFESNIFANLPMDERDNNLTEDNETDSTEMMVARNNKRRTRKKKNQQQASLNAKPEESSNTNNLLKESLKIDEHQETMDLSNQRISRTTKLTTTVPLAEMYCFINNFTKQLLPRECLICNEKVNQTRSKHYKQKRHFQTVVDYIEKNGPEYGINVINFWAIFCLPCNCIVWRNLGHYETEAHKRAVTTFCPLCLTFDGSDIHKSHKVEYLKRMKSESTLNFKEGTISYFDDALPPPPSLLDDHVEHASKCTNRGPAAASGGNTPRPPDGKRDALEVGLAILKQTLFNVAKFPARPLKTVPLAGSIMFFRNFKSALQTGGTLERTFDWCAANYPAGTAATFEWFGTQHDQLLNTVLAKEIDHFNRLLSSSDKDTVVLHVVCFNMNLNVFLEECKLVEEFLALPDGEKTDADIIVNVSRQLDFVYEHCPSFDLGLLLDTLLIELNRHGRRADVSGAFEKIAAGGNGTVTRQHLSLLHSKLECLKQLAWLRVGDRSCEAYYNYLGRVYWELKHVAHRTYTSFEAQPKRNERICEAFCEMRRTVMRLMDADNVRCLMMLLLQLAEDLFLPASGPLGSMPNVIIPEIWPKKPFILNVVKTLNDFDIRRLWIYRLLDDIAVNSFSMGYIEVYMSDVMRDFSRTLPKKLDDGSSFDHARECVCVGDRLCGC